MIRPEHLITRRLDLRRPEKEDAAALYACSFSKPEVMRFLTWKQHRTQEETRALLDGMRERWERSSQAHWVMHLREERTAVGVVSLRLEGRANLSYLLGEEFWGRGLMTEAGSEVCRWAFDHNEIEELWAFCSTENTSSVRVLAKIGFQEDGLLPRYAVFPNTGETPQDCLLFTRRRP